jgi:hypothetical protein
LLNHIAKSYTKRFGKVLRVADYGVTKLMHMLDKMTKGFVEVKIYFIGRKNIKLRNNQLLQKKKNYGKTFYTYYIWIII